jgi:hypothetical protein
VQLKQLNRYFPLADAAMSALERWIDVIDPALFTDVLYSLEAYLKTTSDLDKTVDDEKLLQAEREFQVHPPLFSVLHTHLNRA